MIYKSPLLTVDGIIFKEDQILDLLKNLGGDINYVCQFKPAISGLINMGLIDTLRKHPAVEYIVYDIPIEPFEQTLPWGVERIGAPVLHTSGNKGTGINVAVLDTGIDTDHPDLSFVFGFDFSGRFIDDPDPQTGEGEVIIKAPNVMQGYYRDPEKTKEVIRKTSENYSSMLQSVQKGKKTEIDSINGAIIGTGNTINVDVSLNEMLMTLIIS